ncbi:MAG TPA: metallophosphoesterase family protein [Spirochaetota bacterium]|nr:metallophosphoesterase family protein [Spirochaetota bacterium]HOR44156.1 metallophosphoesterase family protein [Spirochaetota bacterium]HPK55118.1 metallophosphoesterase family protein [Spirochaetota bacterium]
MLIGIIADTHNNVEMIIKAVSYLRSRRINTLIHAGDLSSPQMLDFFRGFDLYIVLGNDDCSNDEMNQKLASLGLEPACCAKEFEFDGKKFILFHGDNVPMFRDAVNSEKYDYIIKGHLHCVENYERKNTRIINPGSLRKGEENTIAILDTSTGDVTHVDMNAVDPYNYS